MLGQNGRYNGRYWVKITNSGSKLPLSDKVTGVGPKLPIRGQNSLCRVKWPVLDQNGLCLVQMADFGSKWPKSIHNDRCLLKMGDVGSKLLISDQKGRYFVGMAEFGSKWPMFRSMIGGPLIPYKGFKRTFPLVWLFSFSFRNIRTPFCSLSALKVLLLKKILLVLTTVSLVFEY